jgi:hypothetical protein
MRHPRRTGLFVAASLAAGGLTVAVLLVGPAWASGQVCEGVVVDEGSGAAPAPQTADVDPGSSDLDALSAAGDSFTQNSSGLVCAIDNYPANGLANCLNTANGLYYFWSYWEGDPYTNTWTYAPIGPAEHTVSSGQTYVQGWRYQDPGPDSPSATKPSVTPAAAFAQACPGVSPVPTSGGSAGAGSTGSGGSGGVPTSPTTAPTPPPTTVAAGPPPSATAPGTAASASHAAAPSMQTQPRSSTGSGPSGAGDDATSTTTTPLSGRAQPLAKAKAKTAKIALSDSAAHGSGGDPALPVILVALLIALLAGAAWLRWRRRPAEE